MVDTYDGMAQLRPEVALSSARTRIHHLRTKGGREEVDVVVELAGGKVLGLELKTTASPSSSDARHLFWLRDHLGKRFVGGAVLHTGPDVFELGDRVFAVPICAFWGS